MERRASSPVHVYSREAKNFPCDPRETSVLSVLKISSLRKIIASRTFPNPPLRYTVPP
jgi:hypothetical protein